MPTPPSSAPAVSAEGAISPGRSALSVLAGFVLLFVLGLLASLTLPALAPALYPMGEHATPTTNGLALWLAAEAVNGALAGLVTARLAGRAPFAHAATLGALNGFYAMTAMGELSSMPGWFAIGYALSAPIGCLAGGLVATRVGKRAKA
ncbi:MAG: hypothetical protein U0234_30145 [Sandaracinus sp.]